MIVFLGRQKAQGALQITEMRFKCGLKYPACLYCSFPSVSCNQWKYNHISGIGLNSDGRFELCSQSEAYFPYTRCFLCNNTRRNEDYSLYLDCGTKGEELKCWSLQICYRGGSNRFSRSVRVQQESRLPSKPKHPENVTLINFIQIKSRNVVELVYGNLFPPPKS